METEGSLTRCAHDMHSPDARRREEAARQIWLRFAERLAAVVRRRLDPRILRHAGEDDVLQSLFASFFDAAPGPDGPPRDRDELWRLLVHFTMCKVANTADYHRAGRRDVRRERPLDGVRRRGAGVGRARGPAVDRAPRTRPSPARSSSGCCAILPDDLRPVFALRLEGFTNAQIAAQLGRVERTVELKLRTIRALLRPHLEITPRPRPTAGQGRDRRLLQAPPETPRCPTRAKPLTARSSSGSTGPWSSSRTPGGAASRCRSRTCCAARSPAARAELLRYALAVELEYRRDRGESPTVEEYERRFPEHVEVVRQAFAERDRLAPPRHDDRALSRRLSDIVRLAVPAPERCPRRSASSSCWSGSAGAGRARPTWPATPTSASWSC